MVYNRFAAQLRPVAKLERSCAISTERVAASCMDSPFSASRVLRQAKPQNKSGIVLLRLITQGAARLVLRRPPYASVDDIRGILSSN